jgi:putative ABC transport system permease protein
LALAVPVLVSSGLLLKSFVRLQGVDPGFDAERVVSMRIGLSRLDYPEDADVAAFWNRALVGVRSLPGVDAAGLGDGRPPREASGVNNFDLESRPTPPGESQPVAPWLTVTPGYFRTLGIPLRRGRLIAESDTQDTPPVVVVDEAWARKHFPGGDPVGQRFMEGGCTPDRCDWVTIVGVVGDVKYTGLDNEDGSIYFPHSQTSYRSMYVFARSRDTRPSDLIPGMRQVIGELDPMLVVSDVRRGDELIAESLVRRRFLMRLVSSFGWVAALLAALGIYGVMSYFVQQRTREIGVRIAVGGRHSDVVRWLLGYGLRLTLGGLALGVILAALTTRTLDSLLFAVKTSDPATFLGASGLVAAVALLACWMPARRACRVDPVAALRGD